MRDLDEESGEKLNVLMRMWKLKREEVYRMLINLKYEEIKSKTEKTVFLRYG